MSSVHKVAVMGAGAWGTALAALLAKRGHDVAMWSYEAGVAEAINTECWAAAGNYSVVMDLVHRSADTIVWLDLPRWLVTGRVIRRSLGRVITREQLWNGNRETWRNLVSRRPEDNIIVWAWTHHGAHNERFEEFASGKFWAHADVHRLRSRKDVKAFLASVSR
jgi:glycine/D-amino acid oxidase-like deaminating enzyme